MPASITQIVEYVKFRRWRRAHHEHLRQAFQEAYQMGVDSARREMNREADLRAAAAVQKALQPSLN